ncbi:hypothetical protein KDJ56_01025 [Brevibacillus composti]|uniref:Lipoprotein n=1 Tax=Brevibacillus composti TaxID=2796470 RepID=A0A7T5EL51_9BACL|nr:hypothetical protein [Brevibacillus composti]QQE74621.1 hypothetical protein JD108_01025 [Brevibacillus composti]QUO41704.1 hypothetical protein KDJ56_01025 [Brevibacillus composti]
MVKGKYSEIKKGTIHFLLIALVFLMGCSESQNWVHTLQGSSDHWEASLEIKPVDNDPNVEAVYVGKIRLKSQVKLKSAHYEVQIRGGNPAGNLRHDLIKLQNHETVKIFESIPNFVTPIFHKSMTEEELASIFSDLKFKISWEDDNGQHVEEIILGTITIGR